MSGLAEEEIERSAASIWLRRVLGALIAVAVVAGLALLIRELATKQSGPIRQMAKITIVPNTPPPPPPPPKEEKRPEPPRQEAKHVEIEQPKQPQPDTPPQLEQLKMEGPGSDSGVAGIAAGPVRQDYIGQPLGSGSGGGYAWYGGLIQQQVQQALSSNPKLRGGEFKVVVRLWLAADGRVERAELGSSSGNPATDELIKVALTALPPLRERPPEGMPQPVKLRVTARM